jgi:hypothetical protein
MQEGKRKKKARTKMMHVEGMGMTAISVDR